MATSYQPNIKGGITIKFVEGMTPVVSYTAESEEELVKLSYFMGEMLLREREEGRKEIIDNMVNAITKFASN